MSRVVVGSVDDIPPGTRRIVQIGARSIGVFNVGGEFFALRNRCPHQGGPLCLGPTDGLATPRFADGERPSIEWEREGEILRCPWHAWEFDLRTGHAVFGEGVRVARYPAYVLAGGVPDPVETFPTHIEGDAVVVELTGPG